MSFTPPPDEQTPERAPERDRSVLGASEGLSLSARLAALAQLLPDGATVVFDRASLTALAASGKHDGPAADSGTDLTVAQVAERLGLSKNRIRSLIAEGKLPAYRTGNAGGWHVTVEALNSFRKAPATPLPAIRAERVNLGRWRTRGGGRDGVL